MKNCRFCGKPIQDTESFCPHCMRKQQESILVANTQLLKSEIRYKRLTYFLLPAVILVGISSIGLFLVYRYTGASSSASLVSASGESISSVA